MRAGRLAGAWALLLTACATEAPPPHPRAVFPAQGPETVATPISISGEHFTAEAKTDFGGSGSHLDVAFAVRIALASGGPELELLDVAFVSRTEITAVVPPGLTRGVYHLTVVDPAGRSGTLLDAYRVVSSAESVAAFRFGPIDPQRAGIPFFVAITAVDAAGRTVDGFEGSISLTDLTGTASPAGVGPFTLGRAGAWVTVADLHAADSLVATETPARTGSSEPFEVGPGPAVALAFATAPATAAAGGCSSRVELEPRDRFDHPTTATTAIDVRLDAAPPDRFAFFADVACTAPLTRVSMAAGSSRAGFHFRGDDPGVVTVRAVPDPLPSVSQAETVTP